MQTGRSILPSLEVSICECEKDARLHPANIPLQMKLADLHDQAGHFDEALAGYQRVVDSHPDDVFARSRCASVMLSLQRFGEAERIIRALIETGNDDAFLFYTLGLAQLHQQLWGDAVYSFSAAAERGLSDPMNFSYWSQALRRLGRMEEAIVAAQKYIELAASDVHRGAIAFARAEHGI
jgi:tetratricopeptide (TPR) repeat protein